MAVAFGSTDEKLASGFDVSHDLEGDVAARGRGEWWQELNIAPARAVASGNLDRATGKDLVWHIEGRESYGDRSGRAAGVAIGQTESDAVHGCCRHADYLNQGFLPLETHFEGLRSRVGSERLHQRRTE